MVDLHRHDDFSTFDGFGKPADLAKLALELGHTSLSTTNHGTTSGWIQHYTKCKEVGIKPILGVEAYFKPNPNIEGRGWHLCLIAKNLQGYRNINKLMLLGEKHKYYNPIIILDDLRKYSDGIICSTACIASYTSDMIRRGKENLAEKLLTRLKDIFGDDLYIEIQPYVIDKEQTQELVDRELERFAESLDIKCILTSDSHYGSKSDFDTYKIMHEIAKHNYDIEATYGERYMPSESELVQRYINLHKDFYGTKTPHRASNMIRNLEEIEEKCEGDYLDKLSVTLPEYEPGTDSFVCLEKATMQGLKRRGKYTKKYVERCKMEIDVIHSLNYEDYFLMVADYVNWAKSKGIVVGPGRGSGCNSLVNWALGITEVDSLHFGLSFSRFMRKDKKKMPDIDIDFETARRAEVQEYILQKYGSHAAKIASYGLYRVDNLLNDLAKVCGIIDEEACKKDKELKAEQEAILKELKKFVSRYVDTEELDIQGLLSNKKAYIYNNKYNNILIHFTKLFKKVKYFGTHAAGIAISKSSLLKHTGIRVSKGQKYTAYDLIDLEKAHVTKFDILGLKTMEEIRDLREMTGITVDYTEVAEDEKIMEAFGEGNTGGIFQFDKVTAQDILIGIKCDCFNDVVAASSMNRPGPLSLGMPDQYAENKFNVDEARKRKYYKYTEETYGTVVYQEQIMEICVKIGDMEWATADKIIKMMKSTSQKAEEKAEQERLGESLLKEFLEGALKKGFEREEATDLYTKMTDAYSFNKGHGVGYALISVEEMFYKVYHPLEFWACKLKATDEEKKLEAYKAEAVRSGCVILLPHVNGRAQFDKTSLRGDDVLQEGLSNIKGVGVKAAQVIQKYGPYIDFPDFEEKWQTEMAKEDKRAITKRVVELLKDAGALEFNEKKFYKRVMDYNTALYCKHITL